MTCGVPQGSVLGPLLFIIYTNDLAHCLKKSKSIQFADDTTLYATHKSLHELFIQVNSDLAILNDWFRANKLSLNVSKTNYMIFSNSKWVNDNLNLNIGPDNIERKDNVKFLGIYIDENLNWQHHINACKSKLSNALYVIKNVKQNINTDCLKTIYYALVYSHLAYGVILWGSTYDVHLNKLVIMQTKIIRAISNVTYNEHTQPLFQSLKLLKLQEIYTMEIAKFMYKYTTRDIVEPLSNIYTVTNRVHYHDTRQTEHIRPTISRLNSSTQSILYKGPMIWNSIPSEIKEINNIQSFSYKLRISLLNNFAN
jgi:hypothetical protein